MAEPTVTIKKGSVVVLAKRSDYLGAQETPDGIKFNFKDNVFFYYMDYDCPQALKRLVTDTSSRVQPTLNIIIDLDNASAPLSVSEQREKKEGEKKKET